MRGLGLILLALWLSSLGWAGEGAAAGVLLKTPEAVQKAFEKSGPVSRDAGDVPGPALVSDRLYARFFALSKRAFPEAGDPEWVRNNLALAREGVGRYFVFAGDHGLIERALVAGQFQPQKILRYVGYGEGARCSTEQFYWLLVFKPQGPVLAAVNTQHLQRWFDHVYGTRQAPRLNTELIRALSAGRFSDQSGCPVDPVTRAFRGSDLARCAPLFQQTVAKLAPLQCQDLKSIRYSPKNGCPSDRVLRDLGPEPAAEALRAWLFAVNSFSEFYTGYGYSGNFYDEPENREYWLDNTWLRDLPQLALLKLDCRPSEAPSSKAWDPSESEESGPHRSHLLEVYEGP